MKLWAGVYLYGGLINEVKIFRRREEALEWFKSIADAVGGETVCEDGDYEVSDEVLRFYDSLGRQDTEILAQPVDVVPAKKEVDTKWSLRRCG